MYDMNSKFVQKVITVRNNIAMLVPETLAVPEGRLIKFCNKSNTTWVKPGANAKSVSHYKKEQ
jgi:hypothetical protein